MSNFSVALIDDDPQARDIFEMVMAHHNLSYLTFEDAETAISTLEQNNMPDFVIIDIFLPGMDGYKTLSQLQQVSGQVRFVATTAYYTTDTEQEIKERGFDGYLPKPLNPDRLVAYLEAL